ncbi:MAG TPA: hypothetical protein VHM26_06560 [Chitinophagaceae bacterium]|jgi:hypothetical protein|nr:hypothetical protein [Chitinophagaceae bacterium]
MKNNDLRVVISFFDGMAAMAIIHSRIDARMEINSDSSSHKPFHHFVGLRFTEEGLQGNSCLVRPSPDVENMIVARDGHS